MSSSDQAAEELRARVDQQEVVAELGQRALEVDDVDELLADATVAIAETLETEYCELLELCPGDEEFLLQQGVGWQEGYVGEQRVPTDVNSQAGYTLLTEEPVVVDDLETESRFTGPALLVDHGVTSGVSVIIGSTEAPWGVLGTHTAERRTFTEHDAAFVQSVANLLAARIENERTKQRLLEEETLNARIVETSPVGITFIDADGRNVFANERAEEILGRPLEELQTYVHDDDRWNLVDEHGDPLSDDELPFSHVKETGEAVFDEVVGIDHPDGTRVWMSANCEPLYDVDGNFDGAVYALEDITEQRRLQGKIETTFERITDAFYGLDTDWNFTYLNDRAVELIDPEERGLLGKNVWEVFPGTTEGAIESEYRRAMESQEPTSFEEYYPPLSIWFEIHAYPSESGLSVYFRDITEQKRLERERYETNRALQRLHSISADSEASFEEKVDRVLQLGRDYLDVDVGFLARVDEEQGLFKVLQARSAVERVQPGTVAPLRETYCRRTIETDGLLALCVASEEGWEDDVAYETYDFECYLGGKVHVDGEVYGTLCFCDESAHKSGFTAAEQMVVELITQWASYELERHERERALRKYETIVETVNDGIYTIDGDGCFTMVNDAYTELTGYDREELLGSHGSLVVNEDVIERAQAVADERTASKTVEAELERADNRRIPVEGAVAGWSDEDDDHGRVGVVRDITERKKRQRALEESERRYRTLVEHFPNGAVGLFDQDMRYTLVGGELFEALEIPQEELVGSSIYERYPDDIVAEIEPKFRAALAGEERSFEIEYYGRDFLIYTLPLEDGDGDVFAGMLMGQDVTERKTNERKLEETVRKLEESNRRLEQFAYAASHDLQEPLRMISSYLTLIERRYGDGLDEDGREFIDFAVDGADRMREMIDGLLTYSRIETRGDPFESVDCEEVFREALGDLQVKIEESRAEITAESLPEVHGDAGQLRQVFQNLLSNAIKYVDDEPPQIRVSAKKYGQEWRVSIDDNGIGIEADDTECVFNVFHRLHSIEEYSGAGIGLALCQRIVERHGGRIWVESEPEVGSTFTFTLPVERDHE